MSDQTIPQPVKKANPLANYFRQPKLYLRLPSHGKFYPEGALDTSEIDEYPVYAMTAKDELMFKTPDALMNGQATVEVIKSCVPAIKNPWQMPSLDLDAVLIAIRMATFGEQMEMHATCPSCQHFNDFTLNLVHYLDKIANTEYQTEINVPPLTIHIRPYSYKEISRTAMKGLEQQKIFNIVNSEDMPDEEKIQKFGDSFVKLTELTVDVVAGCVTKISTPDGDVDDLESIKEFIGNAPSNVFNAVNDRIMDMKEQLSLKAQDVECSECKNQWNVEVTMDQTNFFGKGS
jgi:C4-type Zn-finger protein